ncbi:hypothetical protein BS17DRAFT_882389 [Gyrodon lividus]|nr:hypothetical protein BS17DRAFT_882389 [Gyrodon lividus]
MESIHMQILLAHFNAILDTMRRFLWNYAPQPILSTIFRLVIKMSSSPIVYAPLVYDPTNHNLPAWQADTPSTTIQPLQAEDTKKAISWLRRLFQWVTYKPVRPPVPRIVVIRVDGEAVPVNCVEDRQVVADTNGWLDQELEEDFSRTTTSSAQTRTTRDIDIPPLASGSTAETHVIVDVDAYYLDHAPMALVEQLDVIVKSPSDNGPGSPTSDSETLDAAEPPTHEIPGDQPEMLDAPIGAPDELPFEIEEAISIIPLLDCVTPTPSNCEDVLDDIELQSLLDMVTHAAHDLDQEGADDVEEQKSPSMNSEEFTSSQWSLVHVSELDGFESSAEPDESGTATLSSKPQHTPPIMKSVRFAIPDDLDVAERSEVPLIVLDTEACNCALDSAKELEPDGYMPLHVPEAQDGIGTDLKEVIPIMLASDPIFPVVLDEVERQEGELLFLELLPPSSVESPVIEVPSSESVCTDIDLLAIASIAVPPVPIDDVATRSPAQVLSPIIPAMVANMPSCVVETVPESEEGPLEPRTEEPVPPLSHGELSLMGTPDDKVNARGTMPGIVYSDEESSGLSSSRTDDMTTPPVATPMVDSDPGSSEIQPVEILSSASALLAMVPAAYMISPSQQDATTEKPSTVTEDVKGNGAELAVASRSTEHLPITEHVATSLPKNGPLIPSVALPGAPDDIPHSAAETKSQHTMPSKRLSAASGTYKEFVPESMKFAVEKIANTDGGTSNASTKPDVWELPNAAKNTAPCERLLSGSIHAPSESVPYETHAPLTTPISSSSAVLTESRSFSRLPTIADNTAQRMAPYMTRRNLSASMHAPQITVDHTEGSPRRHLHTQHAEVDVNHHPYVTSLPRMSSEWKPVPKPSPPDWTAMPDVVAAYRTFKQAPSRNTLQKVPSMVERANKRPMGTVIDQKGSATNSLDSTPVTASSFMKSVVGFRVHGSGLPLVRDQVSSNPTDFDLRICTNPGTSGVNHEVVATPAEQILHPATMPDVSQCPSQPRMGSSPVNSDFSSNNFMAASPSVTHRRNRTREHRNEKSDRWSSTLGELQGLNEMTIP